ncbi:MAG: peptidyl-prolyl cis-trans isomerase [Thermoguttaceae bacterium]|nr:peptidyl-prolyl cis-trans isomerase [Thermoguttaceae bacterium]
MFSPRRPHRLHRASLADRFNRYVRYYRVGLLLAATSVPCLGFLPLSSPLQETLFRAESGLFAQDPADFNVRADAAPLASRSYYDGAETIGRVGHEAILRRDILHQLKKFAHMQYLEEIEKIPEDVREAHREEYKNGILNQYLNSEEIFTQVLDNHIRKLLFYNDYVVSRPKDQIEEQTKQLESEFNSKMLPELKETFGCKTQKELEDYFEREIGSDYAQEKRIFMQQTLGELWMNYNLGEEDFDPTVVDLRRYYEAHRDVYRVEPRVRWQAMTVYFGRQRSKDEARRKIAHMGNAVQAEPDPKRQEALFAEVCRVDSEDVFASKGGYRDWTERGSLRSQIVENAIFSEDLPVGSLSRILEDENSLTIARIIERVSERTKSFPEVQEEVREKLIADRREAMRKTYEERLSQRFSIEIYAITPEEREKWFRSAERETESATGREVY